ncbi:MAG: ATP-grasp enzyme [Cyanobacteria bacterium J06614_10]
MLALTTVLPLNAALVLTALLYSKGRNFFGSLSSRVNHQSASGAATPKTVSKTVLISGGKMTKALQLARSFYAAGHRVVLIETHKYWLVGHRFSKAVDKFYTVPNPSDPNYAEALLAIVKREQVDMYVPVCSPVASYYDSQAIPLLADHCEIMHVRPERIELLDDKYQFAKAAESFGLSVPKSFRITHPNQVIAFDFSNETRPYILKSIPYDSVRRLDLTKLPCETPEATARFVRSLPISEKTPWIMQEFIAGQEYCTHSTLRGGELRMHCCCQSSAFQVNYENVDKPAIESWVRTFAAGLNLTGQASFDFIEAAEDGQVYAIECNPRTHSAITMFYNQPGVATAYLGDEVASADGTTSKKADGREKDDQRCSFPVQPLRTSRPTYWIYHEVWRLLTHLFSPEETVARIRTIVSGKDAIFDWRDPLPFLMVHHWQIPLLLLRDLRQLKGWIRIDFNIGKLVQLGGD